MLYNFPKKFDPATQRVYIDGNGTAVLAKIPDPVLALRAKSLELESDDYAGRTMLAQQAASLANMGFIIDHQQDVLAQDPLLLAAQRRGYGYTWVPNLIMPNIGIAPGLGGTLNAVYDPKQPPIGAILVPPGA